MRHFFIAARANSDLQAIPQSRVYADRHDGHGPEFCWGSVAGEYPERTALLEFCAVVSVPGKTGTWRIYHLIVLSNDPKVARRLYRKLRKYAISEPRIAGPWYPPALRRLSAALADAHASEAMSLMAGDDSAAARVYDYEPSDAACISDTNGEPTP